MSKEIIAKKAAIVEEVFEKFSNASSVVVVDYRGLTVDEVTELRKELREAGVEMRVIKNTFLRRAADKAGYEGLDETFTGPTAVAFGSEDATAPARIFSKFAEDHEDEIHAIAKLSNREGMLSMLCSVLQAPVRNFAYAVKAVADSKDESAA